MLAHQPQQAFEPISIAPPQQQQQQQQQNQHRPSSSSPAYDCLSSRHPYQQHYYCSDSSSINLDNNHNHNHFSFASTPLTPCSSQQHHQQHQQQLPLPCNSTTPPSSADASPTYSSPAFSSSNSPCDDFAGAAAPAVNFFDPAGFSMPEDVSAVNNFSSSTSSPPPIKLFHAQDGDQGYGYSLDQHEADDGVALLLQSRLPSENFDYNSCLLSPAKFPPQQQQQFHQRKNSSASHSPVGTVPSLESSHSPYSSSSSSSSVGDSQQQQRQSNQQQDASQFPSTPVSAHPLPTPEHTPVQGSFLAPPGFNRYDQAAPRDAEASEADMAMRRAILEQQRQQQQRSHSQTQQQQQRQQQPQQQPQGTVNDESGFPYSLAPSVTTLNSNSPATPHTNHADEFDHGSRGIPHGEDYPKETTAIDRWMDECLQFDDLADFTSSQLGMPKLSRTISDLYQDELYNPAMAALPQSQPQAAPQNHAAQHGANKGFNSYLVNDRLQAAHQAAAGQSQPNDIIRQGSPFRQGSPYQPASAYHSAHLQQPNQMGSELPQSGLRGMTLMSEGQSEPKTISPKDALLDYNEPSEDSDMPLIPSQPEAPQYHVSPPSAGLQQPAQNFMPMEQQFPNQYSQPTHHQQQQQQQQQHHQQQHQRQQQQYYLQQQALQQQMQNQRQQQQQQPQHRQPQQQHPPQIQRAPHQSIENNRLVHHTPDFPASLPSMESTNSATNTPSDVLSSAQRTAQDVTSSSSPGDMMKRPEATTTEAGTYSCTYHGCAQRFESPAKLQKHKREAHRQTTPGSHSFVRDSSAGPHGLRNTQAGPHRCERVNPQTGKACNSIFSRPYDLTRHEDTIHNARKQKVRCHLCTEEKTFSRNDALTRHMRVVHPEVNWPGKQKRKGRD